MIIDPFEKSVIKQDYATLRAIDRIAKVNNVTPYAVDKVFWLIESGNFNVIGKSIERQKQKFIEDIKNTTTNTDNKGKLFVTVFAFAPAPKTNS
jgi:hypothetical protein